MINTRPDALVWVSTDAGLSQYVAPLESSSKRNRQVNNPYPSLWVDEHGITWISMTGGYFERPSDPSSTGVSTLSHLKSLRLRFPESQWASLTNGSNNLGNLPQTFASGQDW